MAKLLAQLVLPPGCLFLGFGIGLLILPRKPVWGRRLLWSVLALSYLLSTSFVGYGLSRIAEVVPPLDWAAVESVRPQAIIVLGAGAEVAAPEFQVAAVPSDSSLRRAFYAAFLHRRTNLPLLVSGGGAQEMTSEAGALRFALDEWGVRSRWVEAESSTTRENALNCKAALHPEGIKRIILVTHATHAVRAVREFRSAGFEVLPAPTRYHSPGGGGWYLWLLPDAGALLKSSGAIRSLLASAWASL